MAHTQQIDDYLQRVYKPGSSLYYSLRFAQPEAREALIVLHAWLHEVAEIFYQCQDFGVVRLKLEWWSHELQRLFDGEPRHPLAVAMAESILTKHPIAQADLQAWVDHQLQLLQTRQYPDFAALRAFCAEGYGRTSQIATQLMGYQHPQTLQYAHTLGIALQLLSLLRYLRRDVLKGRMTLADEDLQQHGLVATGLLQQTDHPNLQAVFAQQAQRIRETFAEAQRLLPAEDQQSQRAGLVRAKLGLSILNTLEKENFPVLQQHVMLTPIKKLMIAWGVVWRLRLGMV